MKKLLLALMTLVAGTVCAMEKPEKNDELAKKNIKRCENAKAASMLLPFASWLITNYFGAKIQDMLPETKDQIFLLNYKHDDVSSAQSKKKFKICYENEKAAKLLVQLIHSLKYKNIQTIIKHAFPKIEDQIFVAKLYFYMHGDASLVADDFRRGMFKVGQDYFFTFKELLDHNKIKIMDKRLILPRHRLNDISQINELPDAHLIMYINLSANYLKKLKKGTFKKFENLTRLTLVQNPDLVLEPGVFAGLMKLKLLVLSYKAGLFKPGIFNASENVGESKKLESLENISIWGNTQRDIVAVAAEVRACGDLASDVKIDYTTYF